MQVFLPYSDIYKSAMVLDMQRLNKQILESDQMINAELTNNDKFYKNHPARKMWAKNIGAHKVYRDIMLEAWYKRGGKGTRGYWWNTGSYYTKQDANPQSISPEFPDWFNNNEELEKLNKSHRRALLIKKFDYYKDLFPEDIDDLVLEGAKLTGYTKLITRGKNKGTVKNISTTEHKQQFIRDNNIYYWIK